MIIRRVECVICTNSPLVSIAKLQDFPIRCCSDTKEKHDIFWNMEIGVCNQCGSLHQMNLLDLDILYGGKYILNTTYSKDWLRHYDEFALFIKKNINQEASIVEIGSSSHILLDRLIDHYPNYTIFDFSLDTVTMPKEHVKYIEGNCEKFIFDPKDVIVMSHVFEHLYNPKVFINNCMKNNVKYILLSIPNMNNPSTIHIAREHTFTYNDSDIMYLFGKYRYECIERVLFKDNHSIFYCFCLSNHIISIPRINKSEGYQRTKEFLNSTITVPPDTYLLGAGYHSQCIYANITNKENIIGIVDNDKTKQNKYFFNTSLQIQPFSVFADIPYGNALIFSNRYFTDEIIQQIKNINHRINIIYI